MDTERETESGSPQNNLADRKYLELGWKTWTEAKQVAKDRSNKKSTAALWAMGPEEDRKGKVVCILFLVLP